MARRKIGLIHTGAGLVTVFRELCDELLPSVDVFNIVDDSLILDLITDAQSASSIGHRLGSHLQCAQLAGAEMALVTCSSVGEAAEAARGVVSIPILRVDQPMVDRAVSQANRIGVVATLATTLTPTTNLVQRRATELGAVVQVSARLCQGAFEALNRGDTQAHDQRVQQQIAELASEVDTIILAQASMARVLTPPLLSQIGLPILSSPRLAIESLAAALNSERSADPACATTANNPTPGCRT